MRPTVMLGVAPEGPWREEDSLAAMGLAQYEAMVCECGCGYLKQDCQNDLNDGHFEVDDTRICQAKAAIDRWQSRNDTREPGQLLATRFTPPNR